MPWRGVLAASPTPISAATGDFVSYLLGYGPIGLFLLLLAWLFYRGWGLYSPSRLKAEKDACRADLEHQITQMTEDRNRERTRLIDERDKAYAQRDEALKAATDSLVPLLVQFTSATGALLPLLQKMVTITEAREDRGERRDRGGR